MQTDATALKADRRADLSIRSTVAFNGWVARMAATQRISVATLIEHALLDYSEKYSFEEDVPYRLPKHGKYDDPPNP